MNDFKSIKLAGRLRAVIMAKGKGRELSLTLDGQSIEAKELRWLIHHLHMYNVEVSIRADEAVTVKQLRTHLSEWKEWSPFWTFVKVQKVNMIN